MWYFSVIISCVICAAHSGLINQTKKIVGGQDTTIEEVPWQATIHYYRINQCGGAIIDDETILTAAHCFEVSDIDIYPEAFTVRVGNTKRSVGGEQYENRKIIRHPQFKLSNYHYDIAIVKLAKKLTFSREVKPIALPGYLEALPYGEKALITGWGQLSFGGSFPMDLQKVYLPIIDQKRCEQAYKSINAIQPYMFCAGTFDGKKDACKGDSGGPVVARNKLIGIVSWGIDCAIPEYPGVFTKVSALRRWIDQNRVL